MTWRLFIAVIALLFAGFGFWAQDQLRKGQPLVLASAQVYPQPKILSHFELLGDDGKPYGRDRWLNGWDLVFFGYTQCPDVCPNTMNLLHLLNKELHRQDQLEHYPRVTFISVDPERDQAQQLGQYVRYFDPEFKGATGEPQQLAALTHQLGSVYFVEEHDEGALSYAVDHSSAIMLIDPQARLFARFPAPHEIEGMADDLTTILQSY